MDEEKKYLSQRRYLILRKLGDGATGSVYLAEDTTKEAGSNLCAVKELRPRDPDPFSQREFSKRFKDEKNYLDKLGGFNEQIPKLIDCFSEDDEDGGETHYIVQEYVEGEKLSDLVAGGWLDEDRVKEIIIQLLPVLAHIHYTGYVHRDVNPTNIILRRRNGLPVLIDYGAVKDLDATLVASAEGSKTHTYVIGKTGYMAPEHLDGSPEPASDLYSLGVTAIVMLTGLKPARIGRDAITGKLRWREQARHVSAAFAAVLDQAVSPLARERFEGRADDMRVALEALGLSPKEQLKRMLGDAWTSLLERQPQLPAGRFEKCSGCDFYLRAGDEHCLNCGAYNIRLLDNYERGLLRDAKGEREKGGRTNRWEVTRTRKVPEEVEDDFGGASLGCYVAVIGAVIGLIVGWTEGNGFFNTIGTMIGGGFWGTIVGVFLGGLVVGIQWLLSVYRRHRREQERLSEELRLEEQERRRGQLETRLQRAMEECHDSGSCLIGVEAQIRREVQDILTKRERINERLKAAQQTGAEVLAASELRELEAELTFALMRDRKKQNRYEIKRSEIELFKLHHKLQANRGPRIDYAAGKAMEETLIDMHGRVKKILNELDEAKVISSGAGKAWLARLLRTEEILERARRLLVGHLARLISDEGAEAPRELERSLNLLNAYLTYEDFYREYQSLGAE